MGRAKYTEEERRAIVATFVQATREIIDERGTSEVSIRKVSDRTGYSSATLYLYFKDLDELITLASIGYLESYCRSLVSSRPRNETTIETYLRSWRQFCLYTLPKPTVFLLLFYGRHETPLDEMVRRYYTIYPEQLDSISGPVLSMLLAGSLYERNLKVLAPCTRELGYDDARTSLINDVTVSYYRTVLERAEESCPDEEAIIGITDDFIDACGYLLHLS